MERSPIDTWHSQSMQAHQSTLQFKTVVYIPRSIFSRVRISIELPADKGL